MLYEEAINTRGAEAAMDFPDGSKKHHETFDGENFNGDDQQETDEERPGLQK